MNTQGDCRYGALAAPSSSLASTYQTVTELPTVTCIQAEPRYIIDLRTRQVYPARCRRNRCAHCLPINARRRALAMSASRPTRMIRLSLVADRGDPDPLDTARTRVKRVRQALKRLGVPSGQWSWTLEVNPAGTGYHAHAVQHGSYIPQAALQEACERAGAGIPYINVIKSNASRTARYGLKAFGAAGYGLKTYRQSTHAEEALTLNHGRLEHHTPEFYVIDGEKLRVRQAEKIAVEALYGPGIDSFIIVPADVARYYMSPEGMNYLPRPVTHRDDSSHKAAHEQHLAESIAERP